jgi:hypothetical protein
LRTKKIRQISRKRRRRSGKPKPSIGRTNTTPYMKSMYSS